MKKIQSLFMRDYDGNRQVYDEVVKGSEWVLAGEGRATRKMDGTCCMIKDGVLYKRYDVKKGRKVPDGFIPAQDKDITTGHWPGWVKVGDGHEDKWHREAMAFMIPLTTNGTFELVGPKVNGNPEHFSHHRFLAHGVIILREIPLTFDGICDYLKDADIEGIVWHHPDGRMVKIKKKDFGFKRQQC